jgi:hypothetical protein
MSAFPPPDDRQPQTLRTFATKAQLEDYLEAQALEIEREAARGSVDPALRDIAISFSDLARATGLQTMALRFERFLERNDTG